MKKSVALLLGSFFIFTFAVPGLAQRRSVPPRTEPPVVQGKTTAKRDARLKLKQHPKEARKDRVKARNN